ncbi:MAG: M20/M25/M40 family metallo-hydrolase [Flavobacteriaceae bacterium]|nr:M20/M25/M40 family metallo-hydrolase [Muriicola sp.]MBT8289908.1 M20/M25/M40 family metallo-hydrolase [Muriicola sp.]NNK20822.1 M20/M25/M40 family metallo-hydrolase [Flavobacteriaceae bacterium]NNK35100.1 M20/M25/M40 family metallo-hydrolase [Eudoraea sp.]NNL40399.1 M20/M25/M40 family metallo-hydrolase [Flavobacteriaceae bacterium]
MQRIYFLLFLGLILGACKATKKTVIDVANFSSSQQMEAHMNYLASNDLKGRDTGSDGIELAAGFIMDFLKAQEIEPYFESYQDTLDNFTPVAYNIVGVIPGNDPALEKEFVLIGAHYDHIGIGRVKEGDSIANGANDNASGTSTVLELARYFAKAKTNKRSLVFAWFSAEEKGLRGSDHLAKKMKAEGIDLYTVLNYEMTGVPMIGKDHLVYVSGYNKSNIAEISNSYAGEKVVGFLPTAEEFNLFMRSDNYPFYKAFQIPAHTFATFDFTNFDHYHQVGDEADLMDFAHMARVVNKMIPAIEGIVNAENKEIILK